MKILNHHGDTVTFDCLPNPDGGTFSALLTITEVEDGSAEASFVIRPDEAVALAAVLLEWADIETTKAKGLF
jgi:hypothetical protein